jgi:excisionase family DNA binding protein
MDIYIKKEAIMSALLNVKDVQERLGISESTLFRMLKNKEIKGFKVGRAWKFEEADITEFIRKQREAAENKPEEAVA